MVRWPKLTEVRQGRLGSAKVDLPSPPYVVPSNENSAVFCEIGSNWPWQKAQPFGAKLKPNIVISATKGELMAIHSAIASWHSGLRGLVRRSRLGSERRRT